MKNYKTADLTFELSEKSQYHYTSTHKPMPHESRYVYKNGVWEQKNPVKDGEALIMCGGDLMCEPVMSESYYFDGEYYFKPCFKYVKEVFREADLVTANLETMVADSFPYAHEMHVCKYGDATRYLCNAPTAYLDALRYAGFDAFAMANNHACDLGYDGIVETVENVRKYDFMSTGAFLEPTDARILHIRVNGIRIAMLSYTDFINKKLHTLTLSEEGQRVMTNLYDPETVRRDIAQARAEGAEIVLVYSHFHGIEYSNEILPETRKSAREIAECGADIVMGTHMHAIQGYDVIGTQDGRRVPVVYSLSNFICSDQHPETRDNLIYCVKLRRDGEKVVIAEESYVPCHNVEFPDRFGDVLFPVSEKYLQWPNYDNLREDLQKAKTRISKIVGDGIKIRE